MHSVAKLLCDLPQRKSLCPPYQEQSGITGNTIWKLENLRGKTKSMWLQIALPAHIDFSSFTSEGCRPIRVRHVDAAASIAAKLAWKAQYQELLSSVLGSVACLPQEVMPLIIRDMLSEQLSHFEA